MTDPQPNSFGARRPFVRGFTLTELLVVIAVIVVALAIVLSVLHAAIKAVRALKG